MSSMSQQPLDQHDQGLLDEEQFTTLFCRALYDYEAQDASALSFRRGDIIEVLTQQPSGWWDGLLGDERGWFPSNYVEVISDEEAELAFSASESSGPEGSGTELPEDSSSTVVDVSHAMMRGMSQAANEEWLENEITSSRNGAPAAVNKSPESASQPSDFWMPEVTTDGQIFYINTQTGQRSRDLPQEADDEISDSELAGLTSQSSSRSGTSAGLAFGLNGLPDEAHSIEVIAGFGIPRRTGTPEPWVRKLADDGRSYYFYNKTDGRIQWSRPEGSSQVQASSSRSTSLSPSVSRQPNGTGGSSIYSDDSDVQPLDPSLLQEASSNGHGPNQAQPRTHLRDKPPLDFTTAERIARNLQQAVAPPPPQLVTDLSMTTKAAIKAVITNIQTNGLARRSEEDRKMDDLIYHVVQAVRHLLYVLAVPTTQIPIAVLPREVRDLPPISSQSPLKPAQRKVTATLSRLVLSARAMQYDSGSLIADTLSRIEIDAEELERAVLSFVLEVQRMEHTSALPRLKQPKRLFGVLGTSNIGPGLIGAGAGGRWKGFGWVPIDDEQAASRRALGPEVIIELKSYIANMDTQFQYLLSALQMSEQSSVEQVRLCGRELVSQVSSLLVFVSDIHVARHIDIDGFQSDGSPADGPYAQTVEKARVLVRTLETVAQASYNDTAIFLLTLQTIGESDLPQYRRDRDNAYDRLETLSSSLSTNLTVLLHTLDSLLSLGHEQAEMAQGDYNGSIEWRMSRLSIRPISNYAIDPDNDTPDLVDMELAFERPPPKPPKDIVYPPPGRTHANSDASYSVSLTRDFQSTTETLFGEEESLRTIAEVEPSQAVDEDPLRTAKSPARPSINSKKLTKVLGDEYANKVAADMQPWYLRATYNPAEILIDPDNTVKGGTLPALVERLTAHDQADPTFNQAFLMTFKSFTTVDELFDLLVLRFRIEPPPELKPEEREDWGKLKQHIVQMRVLNTFKSLVQDEDVLDREDMYILDRIKAFVSSDEVSHFAAAKQLLVHIDRAQRNDNPMIRMMPQGMPPPPILPKTNKKLKLGDIDTLELARQLTIMESNLYQKIRPMECLQRAREQKTENMDNIAIVIQTSNRIADWVAESVLSKEDSRKRANAVKILISVADRCRALNNFSTMIAITSGLNTPPIRRLKRTWEQVNQRSLTQFNACEMTIDSNKNFTKYRQLMASVTPPCVPFIGVFLSTLQFIQDGNPDMLPGGLVNFRKRQKASEVINDIKRWQAQPFNFQVVQQIQNYIEESLNQFNDTKASSEHFWELSLEREPREREDEKMARLLQESGFL
ncbi:hypothetical protein H0H81_009544 [Sphagnurus paluster]|uniref:Ras GEF n=1 Tax=Sphagnurus paluster TaxID=117069 RepID=A0A9P7KG84_9AGAR|nr:hypothetical protein H0H81_009544 [Sphagnurus paluster]